MTGIGWGLVDAASQLLEHEEREAVQGDLAEAGETAWRGLLDVLGLLIRRQADVWKSWRPWLAAFGLALPSTLLLMGASVSVSRAYQRLDGSSFLPLLAQILLLAGWAWTGGFVMGSVSRRTVWVSAALCCLPCFFCLARFRVESLSSLCLFLFLAPAIWGVREGMRMMQLKLSLATALAVAVTLLTIPEQVNSKTWMLQWLLIWPAWYMVATARKSIRARSL